MQRTERRGAKPLYARKPRRPSPSSSSSAKAQEKVRVRAPEQGAREAGERRVDTSRKREREILRVVGALSSSSSSSSS